MNGQPSGTGTYGRAAHLRRSSRFDIQNSIFMGFTSGIAQDSALGTTPCDYVSGLSILNNNPIHAYVTPFGVEGSNGGCVPTEGDNSLYTTALPNINIRLVAPFSRPTTASAANFFPAAISDARDFGAGAFTFGGALRIIDQRVAWMGYQTYSLI